MFTVQSFVCTTYVHWQPSYYQFVACSAFDDEKKIHKGKWFFFCVWNRFYDFTTDLIDIHHAIFVSTFWFSSLFFSSIAAWREIPFYHHGMLLWYADCDFGWMSFMDDWINLAIIFLFVLLKFLWFIWNSKFFVHFFFIIENYLYQNLYQIIKQKTR